jgi:hypothetical protein
VAGRAVLREARAILRGLAAGDAEAAAARARARAHVLHGLGPPAW